MDFWAASEVFSPASAASEKIRRLVEPYLISKFASSKLASLECKVRYVPIIMPKDMHAKYPARSKLRKNQKLYDCSPIINYDVFVKGHFADQLAEYIAGISLTAPHLADLGATPEQIEEFVRILDDALKKIPLIHESK